MGDSDLVSVLLPTYNRSKLLPSAIKSVLKQTYPNWELIVWDDGSEDNTKETVLSFQDNRIEYYFAPNHGKSYALNQSINYVQGELIAFIDDDDQWTPQKLSLQVDVMKRNKDVDLLFGNFININKAKLTQDLAFDQNAKGLAQLSSRKIGPGTYLITDKWLRGITTSNFVAFDSVLMTRGGINALGPFNETLKNSEDFEYWWRFGLAGLQAAYTEDILLKRIKYPGSLSGGGLVSLENRLKTLDACAALSIQKEKPETLIYLKALYRNTWHNMIHAYGDQGDLPMAWESFRRANLYGFRLGALRLLLQAFINLKRKN